MFTAMMEDIVDLCHENGGKFQGNWLAFVQHIEAPTEADALAALDGLVNARRVQVAFTHDQVNVMLLQGRPTL